MDTEKKLSSQEVHELSERYLAKTTVHSKFVIAKAEGVYVWNPEGRRVTDMNSLVGVCNLGHGSYQKPIHDATRAHVDENGVSHVMTNDWRNQWSALLAKRLTEIVPGKDPKKVFLSCDGTEANEDAIKHLLDARPDRQQMLTCIDAFHGRTLGSLPLMGGRVAVRTENFPFAYFVNHLPFPRKGKFQNPEDYIADIEYAFESYISIRDVNALFIELVQGEGGIYPADPKFLYPLINLCREHDVKIVVDEVQTGFGRTGKMFAGEYYPLLTPDIVTLAKAACGGTQMLGMTVFDASLDYKELGRNSNTFGGFSTSCVAAQKMIDLTMSILDDRESVEHATNHLRARLADAEKTVNRKCAAKNRGAHLANLRGLGWMLSVDVLNKKTNGSSIPDSRFRDQIVTCAEEIENGLLLLGCGNSAIRFMPPITMTCDEMDEAFEIFENLPIWD